MDYAEFIEEKAQLGNSSGFDPVWMPEFLFDFQRDLVGWSTRQGRAAIFADCGLGKTPMQLCWAENVRRHDGKPVLIATPLAVNAQTVLEAEKFGIEAARSNDGRVSAGITVTNYERLHQFDWHDYSGVVCDESSILKNYDGARRNTITEFLKKVPRRLLCTATAAPNDYIELGTSSEALGELGHMDMLSQFFKNDQNTNNANRLWDGSKFRFKKHAERPFWRWVCSWARAIRRPSDLGFPDKGLALPPLNEVEHVVKARKRPDGFLFDVLAVGLKEQRDERRRTVNERCEKAAESVERHDRSIVWCHLNQEGDLLEDLIPDAVQVSGKDSDQEKEEKLLAFVSGKVRRLISKPVVAGFGLNLQSCAHVVTFPSHSFEQYYQSVRRCWRFGQKRPVTVDIIASEGEGGVLKNLKRKAAAADKMFSDLVAQMNDSLKLSSDRTYSKKVEVPQWL
jgi:Helicase conserved C-terminal domain